MTVRAVQSAPVKTGLIGVVGSPSKISTDARNLRFLKCPRRNQRLETLRCVGLPFSSDGRGRDRWRAIWLERRVRDTTNVPQLNKDATASKVNRVDDSLPPFHLFGSMNSRG